MPGRRSFKPRGKVTAEDQQSEFNKLVRNQSQKSVYDFIANNFKGQANTEIRPDQADVSNVRYLLALSVGGSQSPVSDFFGACFSYFQRSNAAYQQKLRMLEQAAKDKLVK